MGKTKKIGRCTKRKPKEYFRDKTDLLLSKCFGFYGEKEEELFEKILKRIEELKKE